MKNMILFLLLSASVTAVSAQKETTIPAAARATPNPIYEEKGVKGESPMSEPSNQARPGSPIGGIVVKGGKNPGRQARTENEKGINEAGIKITAAAAREEKRTYTGGRKNEPQEATAVKSIGRMSKPGGAVSSSYAAGRVAGGPLKGIDVKQGK